MQEPSAVMRQAGWLFALCVLVAFTAGVQGELQGGINPIHLNMKEGDGLSPETWGDVTHESIQKKPPRSVTDWTVGCTKEWKTVGTWTGDRTQFDISLVGPVEFNLWWEVDQNGDTGCSTRLQFRWWLEIDGEDIAYFKDSDEYECNSSDPCGWSGQTSNINVSSAPKGTTFSVSIEYWAFDDIVIYYDNISYPSGAMFGADAVYFGNGVQQGSTVGFEYVEAWTTEPRESLEGNYLTFMLEDVPQDNAQQPSGYPLIKKGEGYELNNTKIEATMVTWYINDKYANAADSTFMFAYGKHDSGYAPVIAIQLADLPRAPSSSDSEGDGFLGLPGFPLLLAVPALAFAARRRH